MAPRPTWQGHLRLSLVTCPVALYTATTASGDVSFHLINPETENRIRMVATDPETGPVDRSKLVRGYEFEKNRYIVLNDEEIASVRIESTRVIDIERFVDEDAIDRLYWKDPFYLIPDGKMAAEAYAVIREAMARSGKIALGRVVLHTRERLMALEPRDEGIVAYSLRSYDEVRQPQSFFEAIPKAEPEKGMIEIASKIIDQLAGPFDPESFRDRYEDALRGLIEAKLEGKAPRVTAPEPTDTRGKDLMEMLRQSLQRASTSGPPSRRAPSRKALTPSRKPAASGRKTARSRR
jgi:DNA end-binding protein Ku